MTKTMLIDAAHPEEVRVALLDNDRVEDFDFVSAARKPLRGNIYLARITRVEPSLQAAFVEYGGNRHGFLAFSEIHPDYYQIPVSDRQLLQKAEAEVADLAAQLELSQRGDEEDDDEADADDNSESDQDDEAGAIAAASDNHQSDNAAADGNGADDNTAREEEEEEEEDGGDEDDLPEAKEPYDPSAIANADQPAVEAKNGNQESPDDSAPATDEEIAATADDHADDHEESDSASHDGEESEGEPENKKPSAAQKARLARNALFERYKDAKRKRSHLLRNYKIQEVIKRRQILLVQVVKEERGNKGAALTTYMSLAGRYCVLMPNTARGGGISRKIATVTDRRRLRRIVDSLDVPQGMGLIIRTAGAKRTKTEIKRDYDYLLRLWENIRALTLKSVAPCLIYEEASLIKRAIRDLYDKDISKVLVEGEAGYREAKDFMKMLMPSHAKYVQPHKDRTPIFLKHKVEAQLDGMYLPSVRLKSGGYIVIHQTEALVAIDVNSGRSTRERNIELTALKTNIEAAHEAARQFRLRDLAGLIVIDFIDMEEPRNNRKVEKALKDALKADRARIQTGRISNFGLLELSRQRRRSGIVDGTTHACPTCSGAGVIRSHEMAALRILRALEGEAISGKVGRITVKTSLDVTLYVLNHHREWLKRIEEENGVTIEILADREKAGDAYDLEKSGTPRERSEDAPVIRADQTETIEPEDKAEEAGKEEEHDKSKRRRRRRRKKNAAPREEHSLDDASEKLADDEVQTTGDSEDKTASGEDDGDKPKRRRRRGRRGGRRNRQASDNSQQTEETTEAANGQSSSADSNVAPTENGEAPQEAEASGETLSETVPEESAKAEDRGNDAVAAEAEPQIEPSEPEAEIAPEPKKPTRKGWWQRATGT